jgi:PST family polysaccharide transporter
LLFNDPRAVPVLRVLALYFPLIALSNVHDALLMRGLLFRRRLVADLAQALSKGAGAITFALLGLGPWSLIGGQLLGAVAAGLACWSLVPWRPLRRWDWAEAKGLLSYGSATMSLNTVARFLVNADYLFIGRSLGAGPLGVYTLAFRIPEMFILELCGAITRVLFPVYTTKRDDPDAYRRGFLLTTRYLALVTVPLGIGLVITAEPLVLTLFGERWHAAAPVLRAIAVFATLQSLLYNVGDVYKAQGRMHLMTVLALAQGVLLLPALWWSASVLRSIEAVAWTHAAVALLAALVQAAVVTRTLEVRPWQLVRAVTPAVSGGIGLAVAALGALALLPAVSPAGELAVGCLAGALGYLGTLGAFHRGVLVDLGDILVPASRGRRASW